MHLLLLYDVVLQIACWVSGWTFRDSLLVQLSIVQLNAVPERHSAVFFVNGVKEQGKEWVGGIFCEHRGIFISRTIAN